MDIKAPFLMFHDIPMSVFKSTGFRQKLSNGSETQMEEEDALAVGYEVSFAFQLKFPLITPISQ